MPLLDLVLGRPLANSEERGEQIGIKAGIPIFGLDALSSTAYGPEAALTILLPLGVAGLAHIIPLTVCVVVLLTIVFFSYRQTIAAYPGGGGSYTVAHENLGTFPGLLAAAALLIDYVLTAAVGISAGIGALVSAFPTLHKHTLGLCLLALLLITLVNLRGVRETGGVFMAPTYLFLVCMLVAIVIGTVKAIVHGGHPVPVVPPPAPTAAATAVSAWLLLKAFSSGCTAMTGVEAVSNGVRAFREPRVKITQQTLGIIIACLIVMLLGIAFLVRAYGIVATDPGSDQYQSILSMMLLAVSGRGWFYYLAIASILLVLIFSANTAFADFPRVCRTIAEDRYMPISFANRGRRLVYTEGILVLALVAGFLLIIFGGVTDRLIPLYAVGAFLAFTLSQAGMVAHWRRENGSKDKILFNALGALVTGATVIVIILAKFTEGAWVTVVLIPALLILMYRVRSHYDHVAVQLAAPNPVNTESLTLPIAVIPMPYWSSVGESAMRTALVISKELKVLHVADENATDDEVEKMWNQCICQPIVDAGFPAPELVVLRSPYRFIVSPIVEYVTRLAQENPGRRIITLVPELIEKHWYGYFLHTQRASLLKARFLMTGNDRVSVLNIPCYLK
ncbi:MAG: APC family permease [Acidobacteriaceae bacterium]|nr:APC family permease [Acidobacteriaceae bacterium]